MIKRKNYLNNRDLLKEIQAKIHIAAIVMTLITPMILF